MKTPTNKQRTAAARRFAIDTWFNPVTYLVDIDEHSKRHYFRWNQRDWVVEERPDGSYIGIVEDPSIPAADLPWWWGPEIREEQS